MWTLTSLPEQELLKEASCFSLLVVILHVFIVTCVLGAKFGMKYASKKKYPQYRQSRQLEWCSVCGQLQKELENLCGQGQMIQFTV